MRRLMIRIAVATIVLAGTMQIAECQQQQRQQQNSLANRVQTAIDNQVGPQCPGIVVVILSDGELVCNVASGLRRIDEPENPITTSDKMHMGSCTKAMTATLIGILVDEGKLDWDETISERLPELSEKIDPDYREITLWQLLTHRAAIKANGPGWKNQGVATHQNRLEIARLGLETKPEELTIDEFNYSNLGYLVAGLFAEAVSGESWETLMKQKLFDPLKMGSAGFGSPDKERPATQPWGHIWSGKKLLPNSLDNPPSTGPAGTVHCSVTDWAKFVSLHLDQHCKSHDLLTESTLKKLHTPYAGQGRVYAAGWAVIDDGNRLWHNGSNTSWLSSVTAFMNSQSAVLIVCNGPMATSEKIIQKLEPQFVEMLEE